MEEKKKKKSAVQVVKEIKRRTRRNFTSEEKIFFTLYTFYRIIDKAILIDR